MKRLGEVKVLARPVGSRGGLFRTSPFDNSTDGRSGVRLQSWLDVLGLGARTDDAQSNGLVVLELEVKDGFDDGLAHGESVLRFALLDDTEAGCCVVRGEEAVECQWYFH